MLTVVQRWDIFIWHRGSFTGASVENGDWEVWGCEHSVPWPPPHIQKINFNSNHTKTTFLNHLLTQRFPFSSSLFSYTAQMYGTILRLILAPLIFCFSLFHPSSFGHVLPKHYPHTPVSLRLALPASNVFDGNPFMDLMDFSCIFSLRIWKKRKFWPAQALLPRALVDCRGQHFCLHQNNEKFSAYKTGRTSQYRSESWLTSIPCEKRQGTAK